MEQSGKMGVSIITSLRRPVSADGRIRSLALNLGNGQTAKSQIVSVKCAESGTSQDRGTDDSDIAATVTKEVAVTS